MAYDEVTGPDLVSQPCESIIGRKFQKLALHRRIWTPVTATSQRLLTNNPERIWALVTWSWRDAGVNPKLTPVSLVLGDAVQISGYSPCTDLILADQGASLFLGREGLPWSGSMAGFIACGATTNYVSVIEAEGRE